jgi:alpha-galactosidase
MRYVARQATRVARTDSAQVWARELEDGSKAVGLFNLGDAEAKVSAKWSDLGLAGKQSVRDLWRQQDLGEFDTEFTANVPRHGVVLVRIAATKPGSP